jgi:hypothetical protein
VTFKRHRSLISTQYRPEKQALPIAFTKEVSTSLRNIIDFSLVHYDWVVTHGVLRTITILSCSNYYTLWC